MGNGKAASVSFEIETVRALNFVRRQQLAAGTDHIFLRGQPNMPDVDFLCAEIHLSLNSSAFSVSFCVEDLALVFALKSYIRQTAETPSFSFMLF